MNGTVAQVSNIVNSLNDAKFDGKTEIVIAPPALYLLEVRKQTNAPVQVGAQNCYSANSGAFTGEIAPAQLVDAKIPWVIIGHSERRQLFDDTDDFVANKTKAAIEQGLKVILCIGETLEERDANKTAQVNERQLAAVAKVLDEKAWDNIVIAYEPVWAIGTGKVATPQQAQEVHSELRKWLGEQVSPAVADKTRILYGGSVNGKNCAELCKSWDDGGFVIRSAC